MGDISSDPLSKSDSPQDPEEDLFQEWNPLDPLPEYTRAWGPDIRRPSELPANFDRRIDPAHIFVFSRHPVTGIEKDYYVTPRPCSYCTKIRQVCSRSRPLCRRCSVSGDPHRVCEWEDGWVKLPGPRCPKPKLKTAGSGGKEGKASSGKKKTRTLAPTPLASGGSRVHEHGSPEPPHKRRRTSLTEVWTGVFLLYCGQS
ncbi:hypothetical protein BDY19DRAFT_637209 [Irpex rosettiformis]|uniref:Uncharacterized protein n=1 Tax=Irpex rosettiformis TaxID=378272 RepID=A0ACB8UBC0_9APHY|nr:hypothetical protein BDY19DRAFT_637209 [Irpex rosettiformis]